MLNKKLKQISLSLLILFCIIVSTISSNSEKNSTLINPNISQPISRDIFIRLSQRYHNHSSIEIDNGISESLICYPINLDSGFGTISIELNITNIVVNGISPKTSTQVGLKVNNTSTIEGDGYSMYFNYDEFTSYVKFIFSVTQSYAKITFDVETDIICEKRYTSEFVIYGEDIFDTYVISYCNSIYPRSSREFTMTNLNKTIEIGITSIHEILYVESNFARLIRDDEYFVNVVNYITYVTITDAIIGSIQGSFSYNVYSSCKSPLVSDSETIINEPTENNTTTDDLQYNDIAGDTFFMSLIFVPIIIACIISIIFIVRRQNRKISKQSRRTQKSSK